MEMIVWEIQTLFIVIRLKTKTKTKKWTCCHLVSTVRRKNLIHITLLQILVLPFAR